MKIAFFIAYLSFAFSTIAQQKIEPIKLATLSELIEKETDQLKVINFWASWCGPCVKELPYFDALDQDEEVAVYFVSLDFLKDKEKAEKLINKKGIRSTTYLLDESNYDDYMPSISKDWSGAIPATLFVDKTGKKFFYERAFEKHELNEVVEKLTAK